ncbi:hypothetical protein BXZ70DRAFT_1008519 [Cristinia sonorae]|uniref:Hypervirulence associated protein TUDOR domain-containing protein n=1 Tax=Cristinia sonorae TaxID=1940300 RepID=A0A8K0XPV2_9AGAR|nr:hypothetical protein BXZ70DRAFT_1008519 [Cristinia sonorae]
MADYQTGEKVEYRPIGGEHDNVAHSTGVITKIDKDEESGDNRYTIKNDNTGKETTYQAMNIVGKV